MAKIVHTQLWNLGPSAQVVERSVDVAWFEEAATCRGEDEAGVAPLSASGEALFKLFTAVPAQNAHQRGRDGQHGDRCLRLDLLQSKLAVDPV